MRGGHVVSFDQTARVALAIERNLRNAEEEYRRGGDQTQVYLDRCMTLMWILRRDIGKLPTRSSGHQPARLGGDSTGPEAA